MIREETLSEKIKRLERELLAIKNAQRFGGDNTVTYSDNDSTGDSSSGTRYGFALFTATTTGIEISTGFDIEYSTISGKFTMNMLSATQMQYSTSKDVAKFENSWLVSWEKGVSGFDIITVIGTITTFTPCTVAVQTEVGAL